MQTFTEDDFIWRHVEEMEDFERIVCLEIQIPKGHVFYGKDCETINEFIKKNCPNLLSHYRFFKVRSALQRSWGELDITIEADDIYDIEPILTMVVEVQQMEETP